MKRAQYIKEFKAICDRMVKTTIAKNADYSGSGDDAFYNFKAVEWVTKGRIKAEDGIFTRMSDKWMRLESYLSKGKLEVKDESVVDTLLDLAVYSMILAIMIKHKQVKTK